MARLDVSDAKVIDYYTARGDDNVVVLILENGDEVALSDPDGILMCPPADRQNEG